MHASTQLIWNNFESDRRQSDAIETCRLRALKRPISSGSEQQQLPVSSTGNGVQLPTRVDRLTTRRSRPQRLTERLVGATDESAFSLSLGLGKVLMP